MGRPWLTTDIRWLEEKYPDHGVLYCCRLLGRTKSAVAGKVADLGLVMTPECKARLHKKVAIKRETRFAQEALPPVPKGREQPYRPGDRLAWRHRALKYIAACMGPGGGYPEPWNQPGQGA